MADQVSVTKQVAEWRAELCGPPLRQISIPQPSSNQLIDHFRFQIA